MIGMMLADDVCVRGLQHAVQVAFLAPMVNRSDSVWINLAHTGLLQKLLIRLERQGVGRMPIDEARHGSPPRLGQSAAWHRQPIKATRRAPFRQDDTP
jgi:hypothetical protein